MAAISAETVSAWVTGNLFESLGTDTEASDAVRIVETLLIVADNADEYWRAFCEKCGDPSWIEDNHKRKEWVQELRRVYATQLEWLQHCVSELEASSWVFSALEKLCEN